MANREKIKTTISETVNYWARYFDESDLSVDWSEAKERCWRCGCERKLQRCHIIPDALDGKDEPQNIVLLCGRCHTEAPNVRDSEIMWDWIKAYKVSIYDTFWSNQALKEYKFIYKESFEEEVERVLEQAGLTEDDAIKGVIKEELSLAATGASFHFGQPYFNTATMAGIYRMMLKSLANKYNVRI